METKQRSSTAANWTLRLALMTLLVISYFMLWQPVRNAWGPILVYPALSEVAKDRAGVNVAVSGRVVNIARVLDEKQRQSYSLPPPAGVKFLLPALFIVAIAPGRWEWGRFFAGHILLSVVIAIAFAGFTAVSPTFGYIGRGIQTYVVDAYSLGYPIFTYVYRFNAEER